MFIVRSIVVIIIISSTITIHRQYAGRYWGYSRTDFHFKNRPSGKISDRPENILFIQGWPYIFPIGTYHMGGGPPNETLLFIYGGDEPKHITHSLRVQFPYVNLIFHSYGTSTAAESGENASTEKSVPESLWQRATILVTSFVLPPTPDVVPNLKWIQVLSAGVDHLVEQPVYKDTNIAFTTVSGIHGPSIAEWVLMTSLVLSKNYNIMHDNQQQHKWSSRDAGLYRRRDWSGTTVGIAGYGSIGRQVARIFNAMGSKIHACTASPRKSPDSRRDNGYIIPGTGDPDGSIPEAWYTGATKADLHTFLSSGLDLLVVCVPLTPATRGSFGQDEFDVLYNASLHKAKHGNNLQNSQASKLPEGEGCIISNISRGAVIDQASLLAALRSDKLRGAALDVTDPEPLPSDNGLWDLKNAVVTPHISGSFSNYLDRAFDVVTENLRRRERGEALVNLVRRDRGY